MLREAMYTTIQTLWKQGHKKAEIARLTKHDWKTIQKVIHALETGQMAPIKKPHPCLLDHHQAKLIEWTEEGLTAVRIHEKLLTKGVQVSYTTVKTFVAKIKKNHNVFVRLHTEPGEEAQVDFGYVGYTLNNEGKRKKTWIFNMRLSYSRLDYYEKVYDQKVETFILCHLHAFRYFGGVPRCVKIDNLKAAILEANFYEPIYQRLYKAFADHYGFQPMPCRVYQPNEKGKVESGIKFVKNNFFAGRDFNNGDDLDRQLMRWLAKVNQRVHGTIKKIPQELFELKEKAVLLKLPLQDFQLLKIGTRKVYHDCHIYIHHNYYSVPYEYVGKEVEIAIGQGVVKIYFNQQMIAIHTERLGRGEFSTQKSHYPPYKCLSEKEYQKKYQRKFAQIGCFAEKLLKGFLKHKEKTWRRPIQGILTLTKKYSSDIVNRSCERALAYGAYDYRIVKRICQNGSYRLPVEQFEENAS